MLRIKLEKNAEKAQIQLQNYAFIEINRFVNKINRENNI